MFCIVEANYRRTRNIARPPCDSRASCTPLPQCSICHGRQSDRAALTELESDAANCRIHLFTLRGQTQCMRLSNASQSTSLARVLSLYMGLYKHGLLTTLLQLALIHTVSNTFRTACKCLGLGIEHTPTGTS